MADGVVPFRVERVPADVECLHFGSGDLDALLARSACRLDVAAIISTMANRSVRGRLHQVCVMSQIAKLRNCGRGGIQKTFGRVMPKGLSSQFLGRVRAAIDGHPVLGAIIEPTLRVLEAMRSDSIHYRALEALCPDLVFPTPSRRLLRHASVRPSYTFDSPRPPLTLLRSKLDKSRPSSAGPKRCAPSCW